jgi:Domain of unknown function (DUF4351)
MPSLLTGTVSVDFSISNISIGENKSIRMFLIDRIDGLTLDQIESLSDALLDFARLENLISWLSNNRS